MVSFQNCSGGPQLQQSNGTQNKLASEKNPLGGSMGGSGNGEPYGGKPTYFAFEIGHTCKNASGNEIASPIGAIEKTSQGYALKFTNCTSTELTIHESELTAVEMSGKSGLLYDGRMYQKYEALPDISKLKIPEKFCYESKLTSLISTNGSDTFYELVTLGSYTSGRSTRLIQRNISQGKVNLSATPLMNVEITPVEKIEDSRFFKYIADIFSISLDLSLTTKKTLNGLTFDEFYGEGGLILSSDSGSIGLNLTCSNIPTLPLLLPPPTQSTQGVVAIPPPPPLQPLPPPPPPLPQ